MSEGANPWSPGILYSLWARLTWHIAWVKSSATAAIPHHGMLSVASIRWATGEVPPAALSARRLSALHTLRLQAKYSEPKREDDRKNEHEDRYRNEKRIGPNQNITWGGGGERAVTQETNTTCTDERRIRKHEQEQVSAYVRLGFVYAGLWSSVWQFRLKKRTKRQQSDNWHTLNELPSRYMWRWGR